MWNLNACEMAVIVVLSVVAGFCFGMAVGTSAEGVVAADCTIGNHRSYHNAAVPEESVNSFKLAPAHTMNEIDLRRAADDSFWAVHDRTTKRIVPGSNVTVANANRSQLEALRFPDGTRLLDLGRVLRLADRYDVPVYIEFKEFGVGAWDKTGRKPALDSALDLILASPYGHSVFVGGVEGFLTYVEGYYGQSLRTFWRPDNDQDPTDPRWAGIDLITPSPEAVLAHPSYVAGIENYGAIAGTRNTRLDQIESLLDIGVRWVQSNRPRAALNICRSY